MADKEKKEKKHKDKKDKDKKEKKDKDKKKSTSRIDGSRIDGSRIATAGQPSAPAAAATQPTLTLTPPSAPASTASASVETGKDVPSSPATVPLDIASHAKLDLCAGCGKIIMGDVSHAMNKKWHIYCFVCSTCGATVSDEYYEFEGKAFCRKDFNKFYNGVVCAGCRKPLAGKKLKALEKEWHPSCFVCFKCKKNFPEMEYYDIDQQPYCETCYDKEEEKLTKAGS